MLASTAISLTVGGIPWYSQVNDLTAFSTLMRLFVIVLGISSPVLKNLVYCPSLVYNQSPLTIPPTVFYLLPSDNPCLIISP